MERTLPTWVAVPSRSLVSARPTPRGPAQFLCRVGPVPPQAILEPGPCLHRSGLCFHGCLTIAADVVHKTPGALSYLILTASRIRCSFPQLTGEEPGTLLSGPGAQTYKRQHQSKPGLGPPPCPTPALLFSALQSPFPARAVPVPLCWGGVRGRDPHKPSTGVGASLSTPAGHAVGGLCVIFRDPPTMPLSDLSVFT